jgi:hypothetical protein
MTAMEKGIDFGDFLDPGSPLFWVGILFFPFLIPVYLGFLLFELF